MFNLDDCIAFITCQGAKILAETLEKELRPYNVTRAQWIAMYYIYTSKDITQRQLADKISVKQPTMVRVLQTLETAGYLHRLGSDGDKRKKYLELTEKGAQVCRDMVLVAENFKNNTIAGISEEELQIFKNVLNIMINNASKSINLDKE